MWANRALELRAAGGTYEQIAQALGYSDRLTALRAVQRTLDRDYARTADLRDEYRRLQLLRTERAIRGIWPQVVAGHLAAIDRLVRILERQARLLGLDAPQEVAVSQATLAEVGAVLDDLDRMIGEREMSVEAREAEVARLEHDLAAR